MDHNANQESAAYNLAKIWYWAYISLLSFHLDTFVLIARKKFDKVDEVHIMSHIISSALTWPFVRYTPGSDIVLMYCTTINEILQCLYHFICSLNPQRQHPWYRQHITTYQVNCNTYTHIASVNNLRF